MPFDDLQGALPPYARDLGLNLSALAEETILSDQQKWGCFIAAAYAVGQADVVQAMQDAPLPDAAKTAAKAAAAVTGMNNVYYRAVHLMKSPDYATLPAHLRMHAISDPGVDKLDFELWSMVVSAINGCGACLDAHEAQLRKGQMPNTGVQAALRIAAVVSAVGRVMAAERAAAASDSKGC